MEFKKGETIKLEGGKSAKIIAKLGEGGQGIVYSVKIDGKDYALKWYTFRFQNKKEFRKNLQTNIANGAPDGKFLWPLYLTEEVKGSFGYIMNLRPENFSDFSDILNNKVRFASTELAIDHKFRRIIHFCNVSRCGMISQDSINPTILINRGIHTTGHTSHQPYGESNWLPSLFNVFQLHVSKVFSVTLSKNILFLIFLNPSIVSAIELTSYKKLFLFNTSMSKM